MQCRCTDRRVAHACSRAAHGRRTFSVLCCSAHGYRVRLGLKGRCTPTRTPFVASDTSRQRYRPWRRPNNGSQLSCPPQTLKGKRENKEINVLLLPPPAFKLKGTWSVSVHSRCPVLKWKPVLKISQNTKPQPQNITLTLLTCYTPTRSHKKTILHGGDFV